MIWSGICSPLVSCVVLVQFTAVLTAQDRQRSPAIVGTVAGIFRPYTTHALVVGVNRYPTLGDLEYAEDDASSVASVFKTRYGYDVSLLTGARATKGAIIGALERYGSTLGEDDALIFYFAGHGMTVPDPRNKGGADRGFLAPYGSRVLVKSPIAEWDQQAIAMDAVEEIVKASRARHFLILWDACFSGLLALRGSPLSKDLEILMNGRSRQAVTAGRQDQISIEDPKLKHGIYTYALLESLNRETAMCTRTLHQEVRQKVVELVASRGRDGAMMPQLREVKVEDGEFVFLPLSAAPSREHVDGAVRAALSAIGARGPRAQSSDFEATLARSRRQRDPAAIKADQDARVKDYIEHFEEQASMQNPWAMAALYLCYRDGYGVAKRREKALEWAREVFFINRPAGELLVEDFTGGEGSARGPVLRSQGQFLPGIEAYLREGEMFKGPPYREAPVEAWEAALEAVQKALQIRRR